MELLRSGKRVRYCVEGLEMGWLAAKLMKDRKFTFVVYFLLMIILSLPYVFGDVIAPTRQVAEVGAVELASKNTNIENQKFSDYTDGYIPEISELLRGRRSGWLTLWTNKTQLGRPLYHISGFSPAYMPSWLIAQITDSPWRFITVLSYATCFLAGLFVLLFAGEVGLSPLAGLIAGTSLATSPMFMYWLTFPMFPATVCWSAGALWAVTRLARRPDLLGWSALAFSGYSLLMTAYPQSVVFHAYLLGAYGLHLAYRQVHIEWRESLHFLVLTASALVVGAALTFPVYRDLAIAYVESSRVAPNPSFFTAYLPTFVNFAEVVRFFALSTVPELFGNPIAPSFPFSYDGLSVTLVMIFFSTVGLFGVLRKTWGWWLAIIVICLLTFVHPLYVLGVKYLGFNLSPVTPLGSIMLPLTVIVAFGVDVLVKHNNPSARPQLATLAVICTLAIFSVGLIFGLSQGIPVRWGMVVAMLLMIGLLATQHREVRPLPLVWALAIVLATISYPLMLRQDLRHIAKTSPLVDKVRDSLPAGSRFAVASPGISVLPPNLNLTLGIASVHSHNSLSSKHYQALIKLLGGGMLTYGRWNKVISPDYSGPMFWMSNIGLILSPSKLDHKNLESLGQESGIHLYRVISRMGESLQFTPAQLDMNAATVTVSDPRLLPRHSPTKLIDRGDVLEFAVTSDAPSVLMLSQIFHRDWQGFVLGHQGWRTANTTEINGIFQGVLLPADTQRVRLEFKPFARYAWIGHLFWLLLLALLGFRAWCKTPQDILGKSVEKK